MQINNQASMINQVEEKMATLNGHLDILWV